MFKSIKKDLFFFVFLIWPYLEHAGAEGFENLTANHFDITNKKEHQEKVDSQQRYKSFQNKRKNLNIIAQHQGRSLDKKQDESSFSPSMSVDELKEILIAVANNKKNLTIEQIQAIEPEKLAKVIQGHWGTGVIQFFRSLTNSKLAIKQLPDNFVLNMTQSQVQAILNSDTKTQGFNFQISHLNNYFSPLQIAYLKVFADSAVNNQVFLKNQFYNVLNYQKYLVKVINDEKTSEVSIKFSDLPLEFKKFIYVQFSNDLKNAKRIIPKLELISLKKLGESFFENIERQENEIIRRKIIKEMNNS